MAVFNPVPIQNPTNGIANPYQPNRSNIAGLYTPQPIAPKVPNKLDPTSLGIDPVSGLPVKPAGTQATNVNSNIPVAIANQTLSPEAVPYHANPEVYQNPWDDPNYQEPTPPPASTYAGQGADMTAAETQAAKDSYSRLPSQPDGTQATSVTSSVPVTTGVETPTTPTTPTAPSTPPPPDSAEAQADMDYIKNWYKTLAEAKDDPQGQRIVNNYINQIGLFNKAQQDGLKAQINQDPNLRGQPAGTALSLMLARDQNSSLNDWLGKQSIASIDRIQQLNKMGIEGFAASTKTKQDIKQQDFQNLITNLNTSENIKTSEEGIKATEQSIKTSDLANTVSKLNIAKDVGDYVGIQKILNEDPTMQGLGISVDIPMLQATSPYVITQLNTNNAAINDKVKAGDAVGAKQLYDDFRLSHSELHLPEMTLQDFDSKTFDATMQRSQDIDEQIRTGILQKDDAKAKEGVNNYFTIGGHDPFAYADGLSLESINKMRTDEGLNTWTQNDLVGVDKVGLAKDYKLWSETQNSKDNTISNLKETILSNPSLKVAYTDPKNKTYIDSFVSSLALGNNIVIDPNTGRVTIKDGTTNPWEDPILQYQWKDFPVAQFDANGKLVAGSIAYAGGDFYADSSQTTDNTHDTRNPATATGQYNLDLSNKYETYLQATPKDKVVGMQAWYYGTAAGTKAYDPANVPGNINPTPVNVVPTTVTSDISIPTGVDTVTPVGTRAADVKAFADTVTKTISVTDPAHASQLIQDSNTLANAYIGKPIDTPITLNTGSNRQFQSAADRLGQKFGVTPAQMATIADHTAMDSGSFTGQVETWKGTPAFAYYVIYTNLINGGLKEADAQTSLKQLVGETNANAAFQLEQMGGGSKNKLSVST